MTDLQPSIADFRSMLRRGYSTVRDQMSVSPNDESLQTVLSEYHRIFGLLDSMTDQERRSPLATIDSGRICRIARGAGTTDQELIRLLISYENYCELILRAKWAQRRDTA